MISTRERWTNYIVLIIVAVGVLFPLVWVLLNALSPDVNGGIDVSRLRWSNFSDAWTQAHLGHYVKSSLIITGSVVMLGTVIAILSGYAFGVLGVFAHRLLFPLVLLGLTLPMEA